VEDTFNLIGHALRKALGVLAVLQGRRQAAGAAALAAQAGAPELAASSLKAALDRDWEDPAARDDVLAEVLGLLDRVEAFVAGQAGAAAAAAMAATACQVRDQDADLTGAAPVLRRGVAKDRGSASKTPRCGTAARPARCCLTATSGTCCATWTPV
jgi:transposase